MSETQSTATATELSRDAIERGVVRINEIGANLAAIQRMMLERHMDTVTVEESTALTNGVDALIQFISRLEQSVAEQQPGT